MRERNPFGSEARALGVFAHELFEFEGQQARPGVKRTVILVSGIEFPRYKKESPASGAPKWKANAVKRIRDAKAPAALSVGPCRTSADAGLKFAGDVLAGSQWRRF